MFKLVVHYVNPNRNVLLLYVVTSFSASTVSSNLDCPVKIIAFSVDVHVVWTKHKLTNQRLIFRTIFHGLAISSLESVATKALWQGAPKVRPSPAFHSAKLNYRERLLFCVTRVFFLFLILLRLLVSQEKYIFIPLG